MALLVWELQAVSRGALGASLPLLCGWRLHSSVVVCFEVPAPRRGIGEVVRGGTLLLRNAIVGRQQWGWGVPSVGFFAGL